MSFKLCAILAAAFLLLGCNDYVKNDDTGDESEVFTIEDPVEPIVLAGTVKVLADDFLKDENQVVEDGEGLVVAATEVGDADFVVGPTGDQEGFLRKVVGTHTNEEGQEVADLEPATLDELIEHGDWRFDLEEATEEELAAEPFASEEELTPDYDIQPEGFNLGTKTKKAVFKINLAGKKLSSPGSNGGTFAVTIEEGNLTFSPAVTIGGQHRNKRITEFSFLTKGTMRLRMKLSASLAKGKSKGRPQKIYPAIKRPFTFMIGAVPVAGTINLEVGGGLAMTSSTGAAVKTSIDCTFPLTAGAKYSRGRWSKTSSPQVTCSAGKLTASGNANAGVKVSLRPELSVKLYGVIGPAVNAEPYLQASTTYVPSPKKCTYEVKGGIASTLSISAKLFKWIAVPYSTTLFNKSKVLRTGSFCS